MICYIPGTSSSTNLEHLDALRLKSIEAKPLKNDCIMLFESKIDLEHKNFNYFFFSTMVAVKISVTVGTHDYN